MQNSTWLRRAARTLRVNCIDGIQANEEKLKQTVESSVGLVTALTPFIGYTESSKLAKDALSTNRPIIDLVVERGLLSREEVQSILEPERLSGTLPETSAIPTISPEELQSMIGRLDAHDRLDNS